MKGKLRFGDDWAGRTMRRLRDRAGVNSLAVEVIDGRVFECHFYLVMTWLVDGERTSTRRVGEILRSMNQEQTDDV